MLQVKELEVRLELADAKLHQAELTAQEHLHTAQIEAANFKEASRLLNEMGDKYKQFEASMNESTEVATHARAAIMDGLICLLTVTGRFGK